MILNENQMEAIGIMAGILTTSSFFPQALKIYKTRHTADLSKAMFIILNAGILLWIAYGLLKEAPSIILANGLTFILAFYILIMKLKYK